MARLIAKKPSNLRAKALAIAPKFDPRKKSWIELLDVSHPGEAAELRDLIQAWAQGDKELRASYPSARMLAKFILTLPYVTIRETTVRNYIESQKNEAKG